MKKHISSILFLVAAILWGFAFAAQKIVSILPVFTTIGIRVLLAATFLFLIIPLMDKIQKNGRKFITKGKLDFTKTELISGIFTGIILAVASVLQQVGIAGNTDAGKAAFISALYILFVPIISLALRERTGVSAWCGVLIALVGFYLLSVKSDFSVESSDLFVLLGAFGFALHILTISKLSPKCDPIRLSALQFSVAFVIVMPLALIFDGAPDPASVVSVLPSLLYFGVVSGGLAYTLQIIGQRDADPTVASLILSLESVFGVVGGVIFLDERMSPREYVGCAVVLVAVVISQLDIERIKNFIKGRKNHNNV